MNTLNVQRVEQCHISISRRPLFPTFSPFFYTILRRPTPLNWAEEADYEKSSFLKVSTNLCTIFILGVWVGGG